MEGIEITPPIQEQMLVIIEEDQGEDLWMVMGMGLWAMRIGV
jgi:hypothetical protein